MNACGCSSTLACALVVLRQAKAKTDAAYVITAKSGIITASEAGS